MKLNAEEEIKKNEIAIRSREWKSALREQ